MSRQVPPMNAYEFCLWLKGFFDLNQSKFFTLSDCQVIAIREKLDETVRWDSLPRTPSKPEPPRDVLPEPAYGLPIVDE